MGTALSREAVESAVRFAYRRATILFVIVCGAAIVFVVALVMLGPGNNPVDVAYPPVVVLLGALILGLIVSPRRERSLLEFLRVVTQAGQQVAYERRIGVRVLFVNGLVLQGFASRNVRGVDYIAFFGEDGAVMRPQAGDITGWIRMFRPTWDKVSAVSTWRGPSEDRGLLMSLGQQLDATSGYAFLDARAPGGTVAFGAPRYLSRARFVSGQWTDRASYIVSSQEDALRLLHDLVTKQRLGHDARPR